MSVRPVAVPLGEKPALWRMLQRYIPEMLAYMVEKPRGGDIPFPSFDSYWTEAGNRPFWAMAGSERVGFALVGRESDWTRMKEFYIPPEFRRGGMGKSFARQILAMYPGQWKIRQMAVNAPAVAFWHGVIEGYAFTEERFTDKGMERVEQTFVVAYPARLAGEVAHE
jgi:predicted acetyltransferase